MKKTYCVACGSLEDLNHHHLVPRSLGGTEEESNLITLCESCHAKAHGRVAAEFRDLTIAGLRRAKERGVRLGSPSPGNGGKKASEVLRAQADAFAEQMRQHLEPMKDRPLREIADRLMASGVQTRSGGSTWHPSQISNLLGRLSPSTQRSTKA
jgi:hypothetical protein